MVVVARISTLCGIGHLIRCKWLLLEFQAHGAKLVLILDRKDVSLLSFTNELLADYYYAPKESCEEANHTLAILSKYAADFLVLDHYQIGIEYELSIKSKFLGKVVVIDDLARKHECDFLIDAKWDTQGLARRYAGKLSKQCKSLLGPQFSLLSPEYASAPRPSKKATAIKEVLCSLGGGGDMRFWYVLLKAIPLTQCQHLLFKIVVGPQAKNIKILKNLTDSLPHVELLIEPLGLSKYYQSADFFIGALGTSLYELAAMELPALTFSIAPNQKNDIEALEDLGHFFHLDLIDEIQLKKLGENLVSFLEHLPRFNELRKNARVKVDGSGALRCVSEVLGLKTVHYEMTEDLQACENLIEFTDSISIRKVKDSDVNKYLAARNLPNNATRMTVSSELPRLNHYFWWFSNKRYSYVLEQAGKPALFIWHQAIKGKDSKEYLYGGWFTAVEDIPFHIAILALQWQIEYCKSLHPEATWLAVINKENKFVNLLNQYMGFSPIPKHSSAYSQTQSIFPFANEQFNFVMLETHEK